MNSAFSWRISRLFYFARRAKGSIALRGWYGALKYLVQQRAGLRLMPRHVAGRSPTEASPSLAGRSARQLLVIDSTTPDPTRDSGSVRLCEMLRLLQEDGWEVHFLAGDGFATPADVARLAGLGVRYLDGSPLRWLREEGQHLDATLLCRLPIATQYIDVIRKYAPKATVVYDTVDLHHLREQRAALLTGSRRLRIHSEQSRRRELAAIAKSDVTLVVSVEELATLKRELPGSRVELLSNIHAVHGRRCSFEPRRDLLFVGGFGHPPNADAIKWFASDILPLLLAEDPTIALHVVGDIDDSTKRSLVRPGLRIHGRIEDIEPLMDSCRASVAPLRFGAGVKGKVNLAMSYGLPVVVTSIAAEGMHLTDGSNALIADDARSFAAAVMRLYRDPELWMMLSEGALANVRQHFSVELATRSLRAIFSGIEPPLSGT